MVKKRGMFSIHSCFQFFEVFFNESFPGRGLHFSMRGVCLSDGVASFLSGGVGVGRGAPPGGASVLLGVGSKEIVGWGLELES